MGSLVKFLVAIGAFLGAASGSAQAKAFNVGGGLPRDYDAGGRPVDESNQSGEKTLWTYYANDWLNTQEQDNSSSAKVSKAIYSYNKIGELTSVINQDPSANTLSAFGSLVYDGLGNPTSVNASVPGNSTYSGIASYTYGQADGNGNQLNILKTAANNRAGIPSHSYASDNAGNLTTVRGYAFQYNNLRNEFGVNPEFIYDGNGNPTTFDYASATYDEENRMQTLGNGGKTYVYRADGLRAWKSGGGSQTNYIYDQYGNPVLETSGSSVTAINTFGANGLVSRNSGGSTTFYNFDAFGNTSQRLNSSGTVLSTHASDEYGLVTSTSVPANDPYYGFGAQFGYYHDAETNLYLLGQRYYEPSYARFVNQDPIGMAGGVNLFQYVGNNPLGSADTSGFNGADVVLYQDGYDRNGAEIGWRAEMTLESNIEMQRIEYEDRRRHAPENFVMGLFLGGISSAAEAGAMAEGESVVPEAAVVPEAEAAVAPVAETALDLDAALAATRKTIGQGISAGARAMGKHAGRPGGSAWPMPIQAIAKPLPKGPNRA